MAFKYGTITGSDKAIREVTKKSEGSLLRNAFCFNDLYEKVAIALGIFNSVKIKIVLVGSQEELEVIYRAMYGAEISKPAFMSKSKMTTWFNVEEIEEAIITHEFGHLVFESNQIAEESVSKELHEVVAQWVESVVS